MESILAILEMTIMTAIRTTTDQFAVTGQPATDGICNIGNSSNTRVRLLLNQTTVTVRIIIITVIFAGAAVIRNLKNVTNLIQIEIKACSYLLH